jgi:zinc transport system ATP-binding protein
MIKVQNLSFSYGDVPVFQNVSFTVEPEDFVCLIGPNGGGKTTMLKLLLGILNGYSGSISIFKQSPEKARPLIGYMPQYIQMDPLFPVNVYDVVLGGLLGTHKSWFYTKTEYKKAEKVLSELGIAELGKRRFASLSGGQRQRALIARSLISEPRFLFLDEPASSLDPESGDSLYQLLQKLNSRMGIMVVSHDIDFVSHYVKRIICVSARGLAVHNPEHLSGGILHELYDGTVKRVNHECTGACLSKHE